MNGHKYLHAGLVFTILVLCNHLIVDGLELSAYETASFSINPSSEFTHFASHNETGTVYVGASDALFQLDKNFAKQKVVNTALENEVECPNYNKILLIDYTHDRLITCGSENQGTCQTRDLTSIDAILEAPSFKVVSSDKLTTEAIIGPGPDSKDVLYVSATFEEDRYPDVVPLSRRKLDSTDILFTIETNILFSLSPLGGRDFIINYAGVFLWNEFTYSLTSQRQDVSSEEDDTYATKVNRICQNTDDFSDSYAEIILSCKASDIQYNLIQAAYVGPAGPSLALSLGLNPGDDVLYTVFAKNEGAPLSSDVPSNQSALCVFILQDIEEAFIDVIEGCLTQGGDYEVNYIPMSKCARFPGVTRALAIGQQCINEPNWNIASAIKPLESTAVIEWNNTLPSSIITTTHRNHTVAFVGTTDGDLVKVHIESSTTAREYERVSLGSPVLKDVELNDNQDMVTILTQQKLLKLRVENCGEYTTCDACIGANAGEDGDPYCGWCTLERRCTLHDSCPMADVSTRWLPYNSAQCVDISKVSPYDRLPITVIDQQITLTVEQLPDLPNGNSYQCVFDDIPAVPADKVGNELTCTTPGASDIPAIPAGTDHVTMQLHVYSTETQVKFVQRDFYFYECNTHKGCVACTESNWACDWCIYSNKCTHDNSTCSNEDDDSSIINGRSNPEMAPRKGPEQCPQLLAQDRKILLPVGVNREISLKGKNLPDVDRVTSYTCILNIEGTEMTTEATRSGDEFTCTSRMYTYDAKMQELDVSLTVAWNDNRRLDDINGFKVTLYRCEVDRPDCSRCLSNSTSRPELMCGWCKSKSDAMCTVSDGSQCSGGWISADDDNENCPAPALSGIWPPSGPHEGTTVISVTGTDLGRQFMDIMSVTVGSQDCSTVGLDQKYVTGSSVSCRTMSGTIDSGEAIAVTVKGTNGALQQSTGNVTFTYRDPSITSIEPVEGPAAGGTVVTITGQYLDACSEISATIGSAKCRMNRMDNVFNETTATCHTTNAPVGTSEPLEVYFDEAGRQSTDFTYRPNPTVADVRPLKTIQSGGITLTVTGSGFNLTQEPQIIMRTQDGEFKENCDVHNDTTMMCRTPNTNPTSDNISRRKRQVEPVVKASFGFIIGDVAALLAWSEDNNVTLASFPDPEYDIVGILEYGNIVNLKGRNLDAGSTKNDVTVYIGTEQAVVNSLDETVLNITLPTANPGEQCFIGNTTENPCVIVVHGNLNFDIGTIQYPAGAGNTLAAVLGGVIAFLVLLIPVAIGFHVAQSRKFKKEKDALILERLLMLQKRVEETIHSLLEESSPQQVDARTSVYLPNNVRISPEDVKIRFNELTMGRSLGHGAFGEVFLADLQTTGSRTTQVAVKSIQGEKDPSTIIKFLEEGLIMKDFDHPNVLGLIGLTFDPEGNPLVILPLMKNGDLKSFLNKTTMEITIEQRLKFAIDAAKGMAYLAAKKFVHRDLAARNCMVDADLVVKIGDFGRSRDMEDDDIYTSQDKNAKIPVKWMAPESLERQLYDEKSDVWSFGILIWEIFTNGAKPYRGVTNREVINHIKDGNRLPCPDNCTEDIYDVMMQCWRGNPEDRPSFQEIDLQLTTFLSNLVQGGPTTNGSTAGEQDLSSRDSYLHPMEESDIQDDATPKNSLLNCEEPNRDSYLHPIEGISNPEYLELS